VTVVLLWDIDGTLLSTGRAGVFALEHAADVVCGARVELQDMHTAGMTDAEIAGKIIAGCGMEPDDAVVGRFLDVYGNAVAEHLHRRQGRVMDGVEAVLADLVDEPAALSLLLTGNVEAGARAKLAHYGLDRYFGPGAFCTGLGARSEIAKRAVELATEHVGASLQLDQVYVIGDTPADVACGRAVGARTIAVASGGYQVDELAETGAWRTLDALPGPAEFRELVALPPRS
jgi:phosphoglycolate phosphatase-like HAD superfamily hydrolase